MRRKLALAWLLAVVAIAIHLGLMLRHGLPVQSDLMALLPREDADVDIDRGKQAMAQALSQRVAVLVGDADRAKARAAATLLHDRLAAAGALEAAGDVPGQDAIRRLGAAYFPHRAGLLALADHDRLEHGKAEALRDRALAQVYGVGGTADSRLLAADPFLLFPAFLADLPVPASRLGMDDGWPTVTEGGMTWVLVSGRLAGKATDLDLQRRFGATYDAAVAELRATTPDLHLLRLGALFYARAGAQSALSESSRIGLASLAGSILLLVAVFRAVRPLLLGVAAIGVGMGTALSACLALFGQVHVAAQLFGASLIGIAVDYALLYFAQMFTDRTDPAARLRAVMPGLALGLVTTIIGYATLALSPFPGLKQVAMFSAVGLLASFLTVVLWFPLLDRSRPRPLPHPLRRLAKAHWALWTIPGRRRLRLSLLATLAGAAVLGATRLHVDDDIRRQQGLSPELVAEQAEFQRIAGFTQTGQFFPVKGADEQEVLRREEALGQRLSGLVRSGALAGWQSVARFVPSLARQEDNHRLVAARLDIPYLAAYRARIGMAAPTAATASESPPLYPAEIAATGALPLLSALEVADGLHVVTLDGIKDMSAVQEAAHGLEGVRFVDPTADLSHLLAAYRHRAVALLALSALLMLPVLTWRYGWRRGLTVLAPPAMAVAATPPLLALAGLPFTFFAAMALVLVLSIGTDYAVFCAEDKGRRDPVTLFAVTLAMSTTLLSFGLMGLSAVAGVRSFGAAMAAGVALALLLAPAAGRRP